MNTMTTETKSKKGAGKPRAKKTFLAGELVESNPAKGYARGFFIVSNDKGLHTRPSTELVKCATQFRAEITLTYQETSVNAKSLLGILTLAAARGSKIDVFAQGADAELAIYQLIELARNKFYIHY